MQETTTAPPTEAEVPTPAEAAQAPATPPIESEAAEPEPEAEQEAEAAPSAEEETTAPSPWSSLADPYDVLELPEFKEHLDRRDSRIEARLREGFRQQYEDETRKWAGKEAHNQLAGIYGNIAEKLEGGDFPGAERLMGKLQQIEERYTEDYKTGLRGEGMESAGTQFWNWVREGLDRKSSDELEDFSRRRGAGWPEIIKKRDDLIGKAKYDAGFTAGKRADQKAAGEIAKAKQRPTEGPNLAPGTPAGGRSDRELLADPSTPIETLKQIRARQKAG